MARSMRVRRAACLGLAAVLVLGVHATGQQAPAPREPLSVEAAAQAAEEALSYARLSYPVGDETQQGMPFKLAGQTTLQEFLDAVQAGADPGSMGVDASGLVVNVYRSVVPGLTFLWQATESGLSEATDASSQALFYWNVDAVDLASAVPGDLLFFKGRSGDPQGVAIITRLSPERVDFVVASARAGKVVETFARPGGTYWQENVLAMGRLLIPQTGGPSS
ncbi:NlpC/P60 family protein [Limnochorda pilosa]|uniref:NlpC/P60 domain-containing protein n=1 Tax=Limnochorda pilosa TaxID=1555112 RepID=A0A0K2SFW5_LIMPI|nr:C40 family peptidase [Limnochorda pilosa]BAS25996.1 hypothetical protein LIP_0139 [Limnochorda pilosa]